MVTLEIWKNMALGISENLHCTFRIKCKQGIIQGRIQMPVLLKIHVLSGENWGRFPDSGGWSEGSPCTLVSGAESSSLSGQPPSLTCWQRKKHTADGICTSKTEIPQRHMTFLLTSVGTFPNTRQKRKSIIKRESIALKQIRQRTEWRERGYLPARPSASAQ